MSDHHGTEGILTSLQSLASTIVAMAHNRLHLLSNDLEIAREGLISSLILVLVALFCLCFGVLLLSIFVVVLFWDSHRLLVLGSLALLFLAAGGASMLAFRAHLAQRPRLFSRTLEELAHDRKQLGRSS